MEPIEFHPDQQQVQSEANTSEIAERLSRWVGPAQHFCRLADLFIFATRPAEDNIVFSVLSGAPPLVEVRRNPDFSLILPEIMCDHIKPGAQVGGLAIHLSQARRVRVNGTAVANPLGLELLCKEVYTLGRKYLVPSAKLDGMRMVGPQAARKLPLDHPSIPSILAKSETAFLASAKPDGTLDVSHRGGLPGFLRFDAHSKTLSWNEYVGDGIFKSAGNIRATGVFSLLVLDYPSGEGIMLQGCAGYSNLRSEKRLTRSARLQYKEPYPIQGEVRCTVESVYYMQKLTHPRQRIQHAPRVTALSSPREQAPQ